jgi:hypothetical protein
MDCQSIGQITQTEKMLEHSSSLTLCSSFVLRLSICECVKQREREREKERERDLDPLTSRMVELLIHNTPHFNLSPSLLHHTLC